MSNSRRGRNQDDRRRKPVFVPQPAELEMLPLGRALKRVRFAADRVGDDAEAPEDTSASAPSSLPAEATSSNSLTTPGPSASATDSPDQVMSEGASTTPHAAVRLSIKRSSDNFNFEFEKRRIYIDHAMRDVAMLLDDCDVGRSIEWCREVCRRCETFLVDVNDQDCAFRAKMRVCGSDGTTVACSSSGTIRELMSNES